MPKKVKDLFGETFSYEGGVANFDGHVGMFVGDDNEPFAGREGEQVVPYPIVPPAGVSSARRQLVELVNRTLASRYGPELDGIVVSPRLARDLFLEGLITPAHLARAIEETFLRALILVVPDINIAGRFLYVEVDHKAPEYPFAINRAGYSI